MDIMERFMEKMIIPKHKFRQMQREIKVLRNSNLYKRLLEFENNLIRGKRYTREDLGF